MVVVLDEPFFAVQHTHTLSHSKTHHMLQIQEAPVKKVRVRLSEQSLTSQVTYTGWAKKPEHF